MRGVGVELDLNLPYSTEGLPGVGGQLRAAPDTFVVEEIPLYEASGTGQHLYVNITKEALTSREVQRGLAEAFDLPYRAVGFAGMKDKHARATQTFSLLVGHVDEKFVRAAPERISAKTPVTVNWVRLHRNKLKKGHLLGNRFTITVTRPSVDGELAMERAAAIAEWLRGRGLPNYYGRNAWGKMARTFGADGNCCRVTKEWQTAGCAVCCWPVCRAIYATVTWFCGSSKGGSRCC